MDSLALIAVVVATGELAPPSAAAGSRDKRERVIILHPCTPLQGIGRGKNDIPYLI